MQNAYQVDLGGIGVGGGGFGHGWSKRTSGGSPRVIKNYERESEREPEPGCGER
jgi:hypothetical protein